MSHAPLLRRAAALALVSIASLAQDDAPDAPALHEVVVDERVTLSVRDAGQGDAVLLLTGGPGFSGDTTLDLFRHVARDRRAILPDQRGTGRSTVEPFDPTLFSMETAIADLEAIREALELDTWTVSGHSWGGVLGMAYAAEHPARVERLVLIDPGGMTSAFMRTYQLNIMGRLDDEARQALAGLRPAGTTLDDVAETVRESNRIMAGAMVAVPEAVERLHEFLEPEHFDPRVALAMQSTLTRLDLREQVAAYGGPVRVIQGADDPIGRPTVDAIVQAFSDAELTILEGAAHWPEIEVPEAFFAAIDAALAAQAADDA